MNELLENLDAIDTTSDEMDEVVISGFMDRYDVTKEEAGEIFQETKKFLTLAAELQESEGISLFIDQPLLIIDEMWHNFILHTKQYFQFCFSRFNKFLHHVPTSRSQKKEIELQFKKNPSQLIEEAKIKLEQQYSFIYDKYGSETLLKWYEEWPSKYTPEYLKKIKRAS